MIDRQEALKVLDAGNLFQARDASGPVRICLVISTTENTILARSVTTQEIIEFDRRTGAANHNHRDAIYHYVITSVAPLPHEIHEVMLSLDRDGREFEYKLAENPDYQSPQDEPVLNADQRQGLLSVSRFYEAHPLPGR
jgi:hypothetical protein